MALYFVMPIMQNMDYDSHTGAASHLVSLPSQRKANFRNTFEGLDRVLVICGVIQSIYVHCVFAAYVTPGQGVHIRSWIMSRSRSLVMSYNFSHYLFHLVYKCVDISENACYTEPALDCRPTEDVSWVMNGPSLVYLTWADDWRLGAV